MWAYVVRRLAYTPLIVFGVLLITFVLFRLVPGDPARMQAGRYASEQVLAEIREEQGWDKPLFFNLEAAAAGPAYRLFDSQFFYEHLYKTATFQFGRSYHTKQRVLQTIADGAWPSLKLMIPTFFGLLLIAVSSALGIALVRGSLLDTLIVLLCVSGMSIPILSIILFGQYLLAYQWGLFPLRGYEPGLAGMKFYVLPVILGIVGGLGTDVRFYRTVMLDEINSDYIRTAYAKGVGTRRIMFVHLLKNAMIPIITNVVLAIPFLFLGSLLLERFFGIPGLGYLMIEAIGSRDWPIVSALTYLISLLFVVGQLMTDICYALVDPRISLR